MQPRFDVEVERLHLTGIAIQHRPTPAFYLARWALRRLRRGHGRPFGRIPTAVWGGNALIVDTDVGPLTIPVKDLGARNLLIFGRYLHEEAETRMLSRILRSARTVLDVGASIGWYSVLACQASSNAVVHAFEANPEIFPYLSANSAGRPIHAHATAVSDTVGTLDFFCAPSSNLSSASRAVGRKITVPSTTLDELGLETVDFVKIDVEGGELAVLRGARRLRAASPEAIWLIEADERMLAEAGSSLEDIDEELALPASANLFTVDVTGTWQQIESFSRMHGALHKNVLVLPASADLPW